MAAVEEVLRCHCSVAVQVDGKPLPRDKRSKEFGLRAVRLSTGVVVQVLGFMRTIRLTNRTFHSAMATKISEGRLLIRTKENKENMQLMLTDAQAGQLQEILKILSARPVATPGKLARTKEPTQLKVVQNDTQKAPEALSSPKVELRQDCWQFVLQFVSGRVHLSEVCRLFAEEVIRSTGSSLRIKAAMTHSIPAESLLEGIRNRTRLELLDLSGYRMTSKFCKDLLTQNFTHLRHLSLRACRGLSDVALRALLRKLPYLRHLDLLEVSALSNRAMEVQLPELETLLLGSLGRRSPEATASRYENSRVEVSGEVKQRLPVGDRPSINSCFTHQVLEQLLLPELFAQPGEGQMRPAPLSFVVLAHCDIQVFPRACASLRHLDLSGAMLQLPRAAEEAWQPLRVCHQLQVLSLASAEISAGALRSCLSSLPSELKALDLSDTAADFHVVRAVIQHERFKLTHFRLCRCTRMDNLMLSDILWRIHTLEVMDVTGCRSLTLPFECPATHRLRLLCVAQTNLTPDSLRQTMGNSAADVVPCPMNFFDSYRQIPLRLP